MRFRAECQLLLLLWYKTGHHGITLRAQASLELVGAARRVPLSRDAAAMSLGHFLEVSFGARHLSVGSRPLHAGYARYFGQGNNVACFLWERVGPVQVRLNILSP